MKSKLIPGMNYTFRVFGIPAPQGSKSLVQRGGKAWMIESSGDKLKTWRKAVKEAGEALNVEVSEDAFVVCVEFVMPRPKYLKGKATPPMIVAPDTDKLQRAVGDALTGVIWKDDAQIFRYYALKRRAEDDEPTGAIIQFTVPSKVNNIAVQD